MIRQVTKKERDKYKSFLKHIRTKVSGGRTFIEVGNKVYETTGSTYKEIFEFQKKKQAELTSQTQLL